MSIEQAMVRTIARGASFTADTLTKAGADTVDPSHQANGAQSSIGALFRSYAQRGWIEWTGDVVRSTAPHRKGGAIRVWQPTITGIRAATAVVTADAKAGR